VDNPLHDKSYLLQEREQHLAQIRCQEQYIKKLEEMVAAVNGEKQPEQLQLEIDVLKEQVAGLRKDKFGDSSEKRPQTKTKTEEKPPQRGHGRTPQPKLPIVETTVELAGDDKNCSVCHGALEAMEGQTEDAEVIDVVTKRYLVRRIRRQKYRCKCQGTIKTAPTPTKHIARGRYTLDFGAHVVCRKYAWHDPLDRQRRSMAEEGLIVTTSALWDQVHAIASKLEPVYDALREHIVGADVVGVDETWWRLLDKKAKKRWWVWALQSGESVYFKTAASRSAATAAEVLAGFEGTTITDGYKAYETVQKAKRDANEEMNMALCWAHVRRKFVDAEGDYPVCATAADLIAELYQVDKETMDPTLLEGDEKLAAAQSRLEARKTLAPAILERLKTWALEQRGLPRSQLRKAIDYMLGHWEPLRTFIDDPYVPLDNNATERAIRGIVLGRKNHYGSRSERGTKAAAICYSLIESAKLAGIEAQAYITAAVYGIEQGIAPERLLPLRELWE